MITTATATHIGGRTHNCDATAIHHHAGTTAVAVIDGIGSTPEIARTAEILAEYAVRRAARSGPLLGLLGAAGAVKSAGPEGDGPDAVGIVAVVYPSDQAVGYAYVGDCRAYAWDGTELTRCTIDRTMGEYLRQNGQPEETALAHDNWIRTTFGKADPVVVHEGLIEAPLVLLTSDGIHKVLTDEQIAGLVAKYEDDLKLLANALVVAALEQEAPIDELCDNATVAVVRLTP